MYGVYPGVHGADAIDIEEGEYMADSVAEIGEVNVLFESLEIGTNSPNPVETLDGVGLEWVDFGFPFLRGRYL